MPEVMRYTVETFASARHPKIKRGDRIECSSRLTGDELDIKLAACKDLIRSGLVERILVTDGQGYVRCLTQDDV